MDDKTTTEIDEQGFALLPSLLSGPTLDALRATLVRHVEQTLADLTLAGEVLDVGSERGFQEVMLRASGRYDIPVPLDAPGLAEAREILRPVVTPVLGEDAVCAFSGVVVSEPASPAQHWHADGFHADADHSPANLLNVLIALHDIPVLMGPTEMLPGSHRLTNHHANPKVAESIVYQDPRNTPELVGSWENPTTSAMRAGTVLVFDDRVLHRGKENYSSQRRYVGYFSFHRKGFEVSAYFEATRSLYPDVSSIAD